MSEYIGLNDTVYFGITIHHPLSGHLVNADETPRYFVYKNASDTEIVAGTFIARSVAIGTYRASFIASLANGFSLSDYFEIHASGKVDGIVGRILIKSFILGDVFDANIVNISGVPVATSKYIQDSVWNERIDQHLTNETFGSGLDKLRKDIYFAGIKFVKDSVVPNDEFIVQWFKNSCPLSSGRVTNPAISVYNTNNDSSLFTNKVLNYQSVNTGALRANESVNLAVSGEPYIAITSGTIDGVVRTWANPIGLDYL